MLPCDWKEMAQFCDCHGTGFKESQKEFELKNSKDISHRYSPLSYLTVYSSTSTPGRVKPALVRRFPASRT